MDSKIKQKLEGIVMRAERLIVEGTREIGLRKDMFFFELERSNLILYMDLIEEGDRDEFASATKNLDYRKKALESVKILIKTSKRIKLYDYMIKPENRGYFGDASGLFASSAKQLKEEISNTRIHYKFRK